ncbi:LOW QUALITY PROTEIN: inactive N-acetylated-alpha-linked acidic dipeptidase-like protein 2 [Electrophorus electricus]|uniref:LOW QUALITY PROTEIN: inactive N-acetylated-alpha-linked acidic dipeptidase-like protein 2 n=1 Tax=Electrophorus electricus TaxID=8005 RepID=UPI0015CFF269|nr:LOW QUALITY PROTEIN: inactive N-acetylated-alpha-linked acidic dipeptidase-like protein 2 [Electrophorus electricus]
MAYRMVRASRVRSALSRDLDSEDLQEAPLELEWELEKELEDPDGFRLESVETHPACGSGSDPDPEPIQPSVSARGRFERLQDDRACAASFSGAPLRSQRCRGACVVKYLLAGAGVFLLGLVVGLYACSPWGQPQKPSTSKDLLERVARGITAEKVRTLLRDFNSLADLGEESRVSRIAQYWEELGLKDIQLSSYEVLVSHAGPTPNTIVDMSSKKCYLPNGARCDSRIQSSPAEPFFAAYSAVGTLEAEVVDIQYGSTEDLRRVRTETNVTQKIALLKVGQAPLLYTLSRLAELGFGASLFYVDPCDVPLDQATEHQAFGVTLNPGGDPSTPDLPSSPGSFREDRHNLTSLLVQPISASLARELLVAPAISRGQPCAALAMPTASGGKRIKLSITSETSYQRVHDVIGYLKGKTEPDRYVLVGGRHGSWYEGALADWRSSAAVVTQIIASVTAQTHAGWQPDRTIVFCSWGGVALGNIGSYEWGEENRVVLASRAVAYVSVRSPVSTRGSETTASPSLFQLASDILKRQVRSCTGVGGCPGLNVSSLQSPVAVDFFSSQLSVPVVEFTSSASPSERSRFLSEAFFPFESSLVETLDPAFRLHEAVAKMTAEAILRLSTDPVLPFSPLDIALDVQKKLKDDPLSTRDLISAAASLRERSAMFQSELMRPANDPGERDPAHVRMLNDVLRDLEKSFLVSSPPPGFSRNILYGVSRQTPGFAVLKAALEDLRPVGANSSVSQVCASIRSAGQLIQSGMKLFENDPETLQ